MANTVLDALLGEQILESNSFGIVTRSWVLVKSAESEIVISLSRISTVKTIKTTYPGLLVIASAALLLAAAAVSSKQGTGAALPIALLGLLFAIGYLLSRKASVKFVIGAEAIQTMEGSLREAADFVAAIEKALATADPTAA